MQTKVILGVYRRIDNRQEGLSDDSPRALELHNRRKAALHDILDREKGIEVLGWGLTDDIRSHEYVEIAIGVLVSTTFKYAVVPALTYVAEKLTEKAVDHLSSELINWLISKLRSKQESKQVLDFQIKLPNGTTIHCDALNENAEIRVSFNDGTNAVINYTTKGSE